MHMCVECVREYTQECVLCVCTSVHRSVCCVGVCMHVNERAHRSECVCAGVPASGIGTGTGPEGELVEQEGPGRLLPLEPCERPFLGDKK